jgi:hypothetical protein
MLCRKLHCVTPPFITANGPFESRIEFSVVFLHGVQATKGHAISGSSSGILFEIFASSYSELTRIIRSEG